jgi:peroxiredoxin
MMNFLARTMPRRTWLAALAVLAVAGFLSQATLAEDLGPAIGSIAPSIGSPPDQTGKPRSVSDLMGSKGLVLMFFRSAAWCPYCQAQLIDMNGGLAEIEKRGYHVAALSYDATKVLADFTEKRHIGYTFLSDPKSEVIDRYNLRDPQYSAGSFAYGVPRPIVFILDTHGVIKAKLFEETFKTRPPVSAVIAKIDAVDAGN